MLNNILKFLFALPVILIMVFIVMVNVRLIMRADETASSQTLLKELRGLKHSLDNGADMKMQSMYPEGYVFFNALYSLAWTNCIAHANGNSRVFSEGHAEIQRAVNKINSAQARATFEPDLSIPYGAFYTGWSAYTLGKKLSIEKSVNRNEKEVAHFKQQCDTISKVITEKIYPVSYTGKAWPADAVVCIAALALHDKIFEAKYASMIKQWIIEVKKRLDSNAMIPHEVNPISGQAVKDARGSSQSLILIFMNEIDSQFGKELFNIYRQKFTDRILGLTGIREYTKDKYGLGDIDSGPVFLQIGSAATIVGYGTLNVYSEWQMAAAINREIDAFGLATENDNQKKYLLGYLPMADAFIAWTHSLKPLPHNIKTQFKMFHLYSAFVLMLGVFISWLLLRKDKQNFLHIP